ncbi:hypothetical protein RSAG8_08417, partial [Rhizoctonia solani AG-8 WAC10335]
MPRKYKRRPRKTRSNAQKAHAPNLTTIRMQKRADTLSANAHHEFGLANSTNESTPGQHAGSSASLRAVGLKKELDRTKRELKNSLQREKRAKRMVTRTNAELSQVRNIAENAQKTVEALKHTEGHHIWTGNRLQCQLQEEKLTRNHIQGQLQTTRDNNAMACLEILDTKTHLGSAQKKLEHLQAQNGQLEQSRNVLKKQLTRARVKLEFLDSNLESQTVASSSHHLSLKNPAGTIRPEVRNLLRQLVGDGVATEKIMDVIYHVVKTFNLTLMDSVSARSVSRAVLEGLIQSQIQIAVEIDGAECLSICGDGTTIKNQTYEAQLLHVPASDNPSTSHPQPPPLRTLGVHQAPSHTSQSQLEGWKAAITMCCNCLRSAPLGQHTHVNEQNFAVKLSGMLTDHAADQKRLVELMHQWKTQSDWELRGQEVLNLMSIEEQTKVFSEHLEEAKKSIANWEALSDNQRDQLSHDAWSALALTLGEEAFSQLSGDEKESVMFFAWSGCCMHKELNSVKGGVASMQAEWENTGLKPPIELANKQEIELGGRTTRNSSRASGGAIKLTILAGLMFNHRDDKRGHQDTYRYWFEHILGYLPTFPDTSSTRYGSYCDAAAELLVNRDNYLQFLSRVSTARGTGKLANIETNICEGLQDPATLTELAVLALYSQAISKPYMRYVRGSHLNALELGTYHEKVKQHCGKIQANPYLLMTPSTGLLGGGEWERPTVIEAVNVLSKDTPHLYKMLTVFFEGALKTWERFTQEFSREGVIGQASSDRRSRVWNNPTNDASEGALGQARQMIRRMPAITENQRNGRVMWVKNETQHFVDTRFSEADHAFVRQEARRVDASGHEKAIRTRQIEEFERRADENKERRARAEVRRSAKQQELAGVELLVNATRDELEKLTVKDLDKQIDKLREANISVAAKTTLRKKADKVAAIQKALDQFVKLNRTEAGSNTGNRNTASPESRSDPELEYEHFSGEDERLDAEMEMVPVFEAAEDGDEWEF